MMRKWLCCLLCLLAFGVRQNVSAQSLYVWDMKGNQIKVVDMGTIPVVKVTNDSLKIITSYIELRYGMKDVHKFTFDKGRTDLGSAIVHTIYHMENGQIIIQGANSSDHIAVYTIGGVIVPVDIRRQGDDSVLSLSSLRPGVYLLNVNGQTIKFVRK